MGQPPRPFNLDMPSLARQTWHGPTSVRRAATADSIMRNVNLLFLSLAALFVMPPHASAGQFKPAVYYNLGSRQRPYQVISADFNNDGKLDLAVANWLSGTVSILLGNGDGTFQQPLKFSNPGPEQIAVGDFDEDGNLDLAVLEFGGTGHSVLALYFGEGNGKFRKGPTYILGIQGSYLAVADFIGDGHLDVAETNGGEGKNPNVMVFFGTGKGTFGKPTTYKLPGLPGSIAAGDLNGDHHPDIAIANGGFVSVLLNTGNGHFSKPVRYSAGGGETPDIVIADLRNNGDQDLVVANNSAGMVVLLNKGNGTFGKPTIYVATCHNCQGPEACVAADFNVDGNLDVACATNIDDSYFFYGDGTGKFGPAIPINDTINFNGGYSIAAGDFNNDKAPDLAIPIELKGKVAIMLNTR